MEPEVIGREFDQLLESARQQTALRPSHEKQFIVVGRTETMITKKPMIHLPRSLDLIDRDLRLVLRGLITGKEKWPLLLTGPAGTGKTCAALCLLDWASGEYWKFGDLHRHVLLVADGKISGEHGPVFLRDFWSMFRAQKLIVIDELGLREKVSDAQYETMLEALERRYERPLLAISNLGPPDLEKTFDARIYSRLMRGTVIELVGQDRRLAE
jgi:IstB-like ATP binding protein